MKPEQKPNLVEILRPFGKFAKEDLDDEMLECYYKLLKPFSIGQIQAAADKVMRSWDGRRLPPPSAFYQEIGPEGL